MRNTRVRRCNGSTGFVAWEDDGRSASAVGYSERMNGRRRVVSRMSGRTEEFNYLCRFLRNNAPYNAVDSDGYSYLFHYSSKREAQDAEDLLIEEFGTKYLTELRKPRYCKGYTLIVEL